eukprot:4207617-Prorocentrum_lima.AAC.1
MPFEKSCSGSTLPLRVFARKFRVDVRACSTYVEEGDDPIVGWSLRESDGPLRHDEAAEHPYRLQQWNA